MRRSMSAPPPEMRLLSGAASNAFDLCTCALAFRALNTPPLVEKSALFAATALAFLDFKPSAAAELSVGGRRRAAAGCRAALRLVGLGVMAVSDTVFGGAAIVFLANVAFRFAGGSDDVADADADDSNADVFLVGASVLAATSPPGGQLYRLNGALTVFGMLSALADRAPQAWAEHVAAVEKAAAEKRGGTSPF